MDIEALPRSSNTHDIMHVVVGAFTFPTHGHVRMTMDGDFFIKPTRESASNTLAALEDFGYGVFDLSVDDVLRTKLLFRNDEVEADIHPSIPGVSFDEVWETRKEDVFGDTPVNYASREMVITMKQAAGRPKDIEDLKYLLPIQKRSQNAGNTE